nr:MAG TPA: hypothetical protein [Caudoviricetes sp.]
MIQLSYLLREGKDSIEYEKGMKTEVIHRL